MLRTRQRSRGGHGGMMKEKRGRGRVTKIKRLGEYIFGRFFDRIERLKHQVTVVRVTGEWQRVALNLNSKITRTCELSFPWTNRTSHMFDLQTSTYVAPVTSNSILCFFTPRIPESNLTWPSNKYHPFIFFRLRPSFTPLLLQCLRRRNCCNRGYSLVSRSCLSWHTRRPWCGSPSIV